MRKFGLEIEFSDDNRRLDISTNSLFTEIKESLEETDPEHVLGNNESSDQWTLKTDHCGYEFTSPALLTTEANFNLVKNTINSIRNITNEFRPNDLPEHRTVCTPHCGFHVHFQISDFNKNNIESLIELFQTFEQALLTIQPRSRHENDFVRLIESANIEFCDSIRDIICDLEEHYRALNFGRYHQRNTIEIRYGASTLSGTKVVNWIQLLLFLVEMSKKVNFEYESNKTVIDLKRFIRNNETGDEYLDSRRNVIALWIDKRIEDLNAYNQAREERRNQRQNQQNNE